ncbi:MAG TPA: signal peptidase I [Bacteroidetes bacterium]|nr:signal peptidase I [Bacteroidota bacterium]
MKNILDRIKRFTRKEWIYITVWSTINFLFFLVLLFGAQAGFLSSIVYFLFWELVLFAYYLIRVRKGETDTKGREWLDAIAFAVITATIIKTFLVDAFTIPTPSMEKSMMVGDFLFVSKWNYGTRVPMTPVAFPFVHNTMPGGKSDSYSESLTMPYYRLPGFQKIKNNDIVVFNYPGQDDMNNEARPVDKRENYIKRCIAIAGDSLWIVDGQVYVNGNPVGLPETARPESKWIVLYKPGTGPNRKKLKADYDINPDAINALGDRISDTFVIDIPDHHLAKFREERTYDTIISVVRKKGEGGLYFPDIYFGGYIYGWTADNFGPIYLPKAGETIKLTRDNYPIYHRCITLYEGNSLEIKEGVIYLNGSVADSYTFTYNYYWMMGDNRHNSLDSRTWGFVPENHIVGKAWFVWMSWDKFADGFFNKVRWERLFKGVN